MMRTLRQVHLYLGVFFAPVIVFFAFTGALQTFDLHKARGCAAAPPAWIVVAANIHKDAILKLPKPGPAKKACVPGDAGKAARGPSPLPLKLFVTALSAGLIGTALIGIYLALRARSTWRGALAALLAGLVVPALLLFV